MACVVKDCQTIKRRNKNSKIMLHSFPKDQILRYKWLSMLGIREEDFRKNWKVCSLHFTENHYKNPKSSGRKVLCDFAFPTRKLNIKNFENIIDYIKEKHDVKIITQSEMELQNNNLDGNPEENLSLQVEEISEMLPDESKNILVVKKVQKLDKKPKIITTTTSNELSNPEGNNSANFQPLKNRSQKNSKKLSRSPRKKKCPSPILFSTNPAEENPVICFPLEGHPKQFGRTRFSVTLKEALIGDENLLNQEELSSSDKKKIMLKHELLQNTLQRRDKQIKTLHQQIDLQVKRIAYLKTNLVEMQKHFGIKKIKKCKCKYC